MTPDQPPSEPSKSKARKQSAAREREKRVERALKEVEKLSRNQGGKTKKKEPQASTTDPESRMMKHSHGGILPSYNVQLSVDSEAKVIAAVDVTNSVNDSEQLLPAMKRLEQIFNCKPRQVIADGDYTNYRSVAGMAELEIDYYGSWKQIEEKTKFGWRGLDEAFYPSQFCYESERDVYVCPAGKTLVYRTTMNHPNGTKSRLYRCAATADCAACPHHTQCCSRSLAKGQGRAISRLREPQSVIAFKKKMHTEEAKMLMLSAARSQSFLKLMDQNEIQFKTILPAGPCQSGHRNTMGRFGLQHPTMVKAASFTVRVESDKLVEHQRCITTPKVN